MTFLFQYFFQTDVSLVFLLCLLCKNTAEIFISTAFIFFTIPYLNDIALTGGFLHDKTD